MRNLITTIALMLSTSGLAEQQNQCMQPKKVVKRVVKQVPKPRPAPVIVSKEQVRLVDSCSGVSGCPVKTPCCGEEKQSRSEAYSQQSATTGSQTVNITLPRQESYHQYRLREVEERTKVKVKTVYNPNRIQLLLGLSRTKLEVEEENCCQLKASTAREPDIGLQYLRDFGSFTGSITGTMNENVYVGLGFNW